MILQEEEGGGGCIESVKREGWGQRRLRQGEGQQVTGGHIGGGAERINADPIIRSTDCYAVSAMISHSKYRLATLGYVHFKHRQAKSCQLV